MTTANGDNKWDENNEVRRLQCVISHSIISP